MSELQFFNKLYTAVNAKDIKKILDIANQYEADSLSKKETSVLGNALAEDNTNEDAKYMNPAMEKMGLNKIDY